MIRWPINAEFAASPAVANRDLFAAHYADAPLETVVELYFGMPLPQAVVAVGQVFDLLASRGWALAGRGLEIGAGIGVLSSLAIRRFTAINSIHALEVVPKVVEHLQPRVSRHLLGDAAGRVIGVHGSFDDIHVAPGHFDFCIEYASLHHSHRLVGTLTELSRVMKPGALLVAIDRAHHDGLSEAQKSYMLGLRYSVEWKRRYGYPEAPLTRRENGESEIRVSEWQAAFHAAGFELLHRWELRPRGWRHLRYKLALSLPYSLRKWLNLHPSRVRPQSGELGWLARSLSRASSDPVYVASPKEHTVFVARRKT